MKFLVTVPPDRSVRFGGYLWWESTRGGFGGSGPVTVSFADLEGTAPEFTASDAALSDSHGFFGIVDLESSDITNSLAFTAMSLAGTITPQYTGNGAEGYVPHLESSLFLSYWTTETNDPGSFVGIVPTGALPMARMMGPPGPAGLDIMVYGRPGRTHIVECSLDIVTWTAISEHVMPAKGSMVVKDASATKLDNRFYRIIEMP